jgi:hypothetical protein
LEYFVGAAITLVVYMTTNAFLRKELNKDTSISKIQYSQSHIYSLMAPYLDFAIPEDYYKPSQSINFLKDSYMKVMIVKDKAYWIKNNTFFVADVIDGEVVKEKAKQVDTMSMDKVQLNEIMFIVEKLREDGNDNWSPRKP